MKTISILFGLIKFKICNNCLSTHLDYHYSWNGGWNYLCNQATARRGARCYDCGTFYWDQTDDEFEESLPDWCKSHRQILKEKQYEHKSK